MKPKPYDMTKIDDIKRWFEEMEGYLNVANEGKGFVTNGTDREGRKFALKGLHKLRNLLNIKNFPLKIKSIRAIDKQSGKKYKVEKIDFITNTVELFFDNKSDWHVTREFHNEIKNMDDVEFFGGEIVGEEEK